MGTLLNRRRYMGGGASLPYDAEVEYLATGSSTSILTDINCSDIGLVRVVKQYTQSASKGLNGDGAYVATPRFYGVLGTTQQGLGLQWGGSGRDVTIMPFDNNEHVFEIDVINAVGKIDTISSSMRLTTAGNYFGINNYTPNRSVGTKYKSVEVYDKNMIKILDLITVRVGQQGAFYDKVSKSLMGVGVFTAGPDKIGGVNP